MKRIFQGQENDNTKWGQVWFLIKHIFWFIKHYNEGDKYILFSSTLKYHNREAKKLVRMKSKWGHKIT